jgi:hypothetical protein
MEALARSDSSFPTGGFKGGSVPMVAEHILAAWRETVGKAA